MAWFQHEVGMFDDRKVKKLRRKCGFIGYGLWCFLLEQIAKEGMLCRLSPNYGIEDISVDTEIDEKTVKEIVKEMANATLIHKKLYEETSIICIPQFVRYYDDYHKRKKREYNRTLFSQSANHSTQDREIDREIDRDSLIKLSYKDPILKKALDKIGIKE